MAKNKNAIAKKEIQAVHSNEIELARKEVNSVKTQVSVAEYRHAGPIPDPMTLKGYNNICPGAADRIITMAENQAKHRQEMEKTVVQSRSSDSNKGINCGFIIALTTVIAGTFTIWGGHVWSGAIVGSAGSVGIVSAFIYGTRSNRKEREQKEDSAQLKRPRISAFRKKLTP